MTISAGIILDSVSDQGVRLTTMELTYPRFIHAEFMTHRAFSRNAASSRAIPIPTMIEMVEANFAEPIRWGKNGKGMQDHGEMTDSERLSARFLWRQAGNNAIRVARNMMALPTPPHKQIVNRILEPFMHMTVLVTATEWENFLLLRDHPDAQPEIQELAKAVRRARDGSTPSIRRPGEWHLPFILDADIDAALEHVCKHRLQFGHRYNEEEVEVMVTDVVCRISAARCARVSYLTHDRRRPEIDEDLALADKLIGSSPIHASPAEHQASPDVAYFPHVGAARWQNPQYHGNFVGWIQHRKLFSNENKPTHWGYPQRQTEMAKSVDV